MKFLPCIPTSFSDGEHTSIQILTLKVFRSQYDLHGNLQIKVYKKSSNFHKQKQTKLLKIKKLKKKVLK